MGKNNKMDPIRAAGGLIWRHNRPGSEILLIHRPHYNDWTLPKGKLMKGESWEQAALREAREETGLEVRLGHFAGLTFYYVSGRPKIVLFWNMSALDNPSGKSPKPENPGEVDRVEWLSLSRAIERLDYPGEKRLLESQNQV